MKVNDFRRWMKRIPNLSEEQRSQCIAQLLEVEAVPKVLVEAVAEHCPHCKHDHLWKWGKASGLQRWKYRNCRRTCNVLTGSPLARLRKKETWVENARAMIAGFSVRETARKCDVHRNTIFRWRHRFRKHQQKAQCKGLCGIAECGTTYFRHSEKGSKNLARKPRKRGNHGRQSSGVNSELVAAITLRDRSGKGAERVVIENRQDFVAVELFKHLKTDTLLITDGCHQLCNVARYRDPDAHIRLCGHEARGTKGSSYHLQTSNAFHAQIKVWMARFRGVATKYLANYLGWHRHIAERTHQNDLSRFIQLSFNPLSIHPQLTMT